MLECRAQYLQNGQAARTLRRIWAVPFKAVVNVHNPAVFMCAYGNAAAHMGND